MSKGSDRKDIHVNIDKEVWIRARIRCLQEDRSLSEVIEELLRTWAEKLPRDKRP